MHPDAQQLDKETDENKEPEKVLMKIFNSLNYDLFFVGFKNWLRIDSIICIT